MTKTNTNTDATDETRQLAASIIGRLEDYLDEREVEIENPERDEFEGDAETEPAIIYGAHYYSLEETIAERLARGASAEEILAAFEEYLRDHGHTLPAADRERLSSRVGSLLARTTHDAPAS